MKKLEITIKPEMLDDVKAILETTDVSGLSILNVMGHGSQKGVVKKFHGAEYKVDLLPKVKVETVVEDEVADRLIDRLVEEIDAGDVGGGKIFVLDVQDAVRMRTGEHGSSAL